ncbi:MAG TPA: divalent-cation tolerance protein CutA [Terriglobales bacterium]|nr:divalent-cation tolerance protein CutA [Terriglobales bacterium]
MVVVVQIHCASPLEARSIAAALLEQKLVACATIGAEVQSHYRWRGKLEESCETPLTLKTIADRLPAVEAAIRRLHSYETPEIIATPVVGGSAEYLAWVETSLE